MKILKTLPLLLMIVACSDKKDEGGGAAGPGGATAIQIDESQMDQASLESVTELQELYTQLNQTVQTAQSDLRALAQRSAHNVNLRKQSVLAEDVAKSLEAIVASTPAVESIQLAVRNSVRSNPFMPSAADYDRLLNTASSTTGFASTAGLFDVGSTLATRKNPSLLAQQLVYSRTFTTRDTRREVVLKIRPEILALHYEIKKVLSWDLVVFTTDASPEGKALIARIRDELSSLQASLESLNQETKGSLGALLAAQDQNKNLFRELNAQRLQKEKAEDEAKLAAHLQEKSAQAVQAEKDRLAKLEAPAKARVQSGVDLEKQALANIDSTYANAYRDTYTVALAYFSAKRGLDLYRGQPEITLNFYLAKKAIVNSPNLHQVKTNHELTVQAKAEHLAALTALDTVTTELEQLYNYNLEKIKKIRTDIEWNLTVASQRKNGLDDHTPAVWLNLSSHGDVFNPVINRVQKDVTEKIRADNSIHALIRQYSAHAQKVDLQPTLELVNAYKKEEALREARAEEAAQIARAQENSRKTLQASNELQLEQQAKRILDQKISHELKGVRTELVAIVVEKLHIAHLQKTLGDVKVYGPERTNKTSFAVVKSALAAKAQENADRQTGKRLEIMKRIGDIKGVVGGRYTLRTQERFDALLVEASKEAEGSVAKAPLPYLEDFVATNEHVQAVSPLMNEIRGVENKAVAVPAAPTAAAPAKVEAEQCVIDPATKKTDEACKVIVSGSLSGSQAGTLNR